MSSEHSHESTIFNLARKLSDLGERLEYLKKACGDDQQLRARIDALLIESDTKSQILEHPADGVQPTVALADHHPSVLRQLSSSLDEIPRISLADLTSSSTDPVIKPDSPEVPSSRPSSRYRIDGEIAQGGMGAVLRGRDTDLGRDLAIKVLLDSHRENSQMIQRFIEEAQIGGQLQHPGIAPVYELGRFADERPFFSMKLVKGETLARLLAQRRNASEDRSKFLGIFEQVCQTLAYAHSRNVIHRDLKPANIMVGAFGEVQVMDWGLAKVLPTGGVADERKARDGQQPQSIVQTLRSTGSDAPASFGSVGSSGSETQMGSVMGTPAYMPPEQALGEVDQLDQRSDVFGLGAILAEILTGQPPYVGDDGTQVFRLASRGKLHDCFARLDACNADRELIELTKECLELEPSDRPHHASVLAERLSHYQDSVETKLRETELQRAAEAARADAEALQASTERRRRRTSLALAASITLLIGLAAGGWAWITHERNQRIARATREASEAYNEAMILSEQAKTSGAESSKRYAQALEKLQLALVLVEDGLDASLTQRIRDLEVELEAEERDRILVNSLEAAWLRESVYDTTAGAFSDQNARQAYHDAFSEFGLPIGEVNVDQAAFRILGRPESVRKQISSALFELRAIVDNDFENNWLNAVLNATESEDSFYHQAMLAQDSASTDEQIAANLEGLARRFDHSKFDPRMAVRLANHLAPPQALDLLRNAQQRSPNDFSLNMSLGARLIGMDQRKNEDAIRYLTAAVALRPNNAVACYNLGFALLEEKRYTESIGFCRRALTLGFKTSEVYWTLSAAYRDIGDIDSGIAICQEAIVENPDEAYNHVKLGSFYCDYKAEFDTAIECFRRAIAIDPRNIDAYFNLGNALEGKGETEAVISLYTDLLDRDIESDRIYYGLALAQMSLGQVDEADASFKLSLELNPESVDCHLAHGALLCDYKYDYASAAKSFRKIIEIDPSYSTAYFNLGNTLILGASTGEDVYRGIRVYEKFFELEPSDARGHNTAATILIRTVIDGQFPFADQSLKWALRATSLEPENPEYLSTLGKALHRSQRFTETHVLERSIELGADIPVNWLYLALSNARSDQPQSARTWYEKFAVWKSDHESDFAGDTELQLLDSEAKGLIDLGSVSESTSSIPDTTRSKDDQ